MSRMKCHHKKRKRRTGKQVRKHGAKAKAGHKARSGRTGSTYRRLNRSPRKVVYSASLPSWCPEWLSCWIFEGLR